MGKKTTTAIILLALGIVAIALLSRTNGFFVQFEDEDALEGFLLANLELNSSDVTAIRESMGEYISSLESCDLNTASALPGANMLTEKEGYDDVFLSCRVLSQNTWSIIPMRHWYHIRFFFKDERLQDIDVGRGFIGF
jgi:hypothetical protein